MSFSENNTIIRDSLSDHEPLKKRELVLYRISGQKNSTGLKNDMNMKLKSFPKSANEAIQPVFHQGEMLLIPTD